MHSMLVSCCKSQDGLLGPVELHCQIPKTLGSAPAREAEFMNKFAQSLSLTLTLTLHIKLKWMYQKVDILINNAGIVEYQR